MFFTDKIVQQIIQVAEQAGDAVLQKYKTNIKINIKKNKTPVTEIDIISNNILNECLKQITPGVNIISEENPIAPFEIRKSWQEYWLIDPLDGTRGFIDQTDDFCICLSYIKNNNVVFGLVYEPLTKTSYIANENNVAYKINAQDKKLLIAKKIKDTLRVVVGRYSLSRDRLKQHLNNLPMQNNYKVYGMGSALKFCLISEGIYDYYPALGISSEWDTAAGGFILRAAGGNVIDYSGESLTYNKTRDLLSPIFFASGDFILSRN